MIDTKLIEKDETNLIDVTESTNLKNQDFFKEIFYCVKIEYILLKPKNINIFGNNFQESIILPPKLNGHVNERDKLHNSELTGEKQNLFREPDESVIIAPGIERKFNLNLFETKYLKIEINKIKNEILENKKDISLNFINYRTNKFRSLYNWYDEGDIQNNAYMSKNSWSKKLSSVLDKKKDLSKSSILNRGKKKELGESSNPQDGNLSDLIENRKIELTTINNISNVNFVIEKDSNDLLFENKNSLIKQIEKKNYKEEDNAEDIENSGSSKNGEFESYRSSIDESIHEEAIDIINSGPNLDVQMISKRIEGLKDYSKNITFCEFKEGVERANFALDMKIVEIIKNRNLLQVDFDKKGSEIHSTFTSKKNNDDNMNKTPASLNRLRISSLLTLFIFLTYSIIEFCYNVNANTITQNNFNMIYCSYEAINEITWSSYLIRNLELTNNKNFSNFVNYTDKISFIKYNIDQLNQSYINLMNIASNITNSNLNILPNHSQIINTALVPLYFENSQLATKTNYFTLPVAIKSIYLKILTLIQQDPSLINDSNIDVMNVLFNSYNDFLINLQISAALYTSVTFLLNLANGNKLQLLLFNFHYIFHHMYCFVYLVYNHHIH